MTNRFDFELDGRRITVVDVDPTTTLARFLRDRGETQVKIGCEEGDCGTCTVAVLRRDPATGEPRLRAVPSCLLFLPEVAGASVRTARGLGSGEELHPVQEALVADHASQCGYCTPGLATCMFEGWHRPELRDAKGVVEQLGGNLCRCTGYRSIRDAMLHALETRGEAPALPEPPPLSAPPELEAQGHRFLRPTSREGLLEARRAHPEGVVVAGATELAVTRNQRGVAPTTLISVADVGELSFVRTTSDAIVIGAATTLTDLHASLGEHLPMLRTMLESFGARTIRNLATIGGNLATASPISDLLPVLLALDARLVLESAERGERIVPVEDFLVGYRKTTLARDEVIVRVAIPLPEARHPGLDLQGFVRKVGKRHELDIATANAAFFVAREPDTGRIVHARLAFGGVAETSVRARRTEEVLLGRRLDAAVLAEALGVLGGELHPIDDVRGHATFRRRLARELLTRFAAELGGTIEPFPSDPPGFGRGAPDELADPSRSVTPDARLHATGQADFTDDLARKRPMLEVVPVLAPHAHARLRALDLEAARTMPGVAAILTASDIPGENNAGGIRHDEPVLAKDEVLFHGHPVALVVADSREQAEAAAAVVRAEYEPLPAILDLDAAEREGSYHAEGPRFARGDVAAALASSPRTLRGRVETAAQEHLYLETQAAFAETDDAGHVSVVATTQNPTEVQAIVAELLDLPRSHVVVTAPRLGGGFGGKETQTNPFAAMAALAAFHTGRPSRLVLPRAVDVQLTGKRHPFRADFEVGFDEDGRLRALRVALTSNGGFSLDLSGAILERALLHLDNAYYVPALAYEGRIARTHLASSTAFRGFGGPQGVFVIEEVLERVAESLGLDPADVRTRNLYRGEGDEQLTHYDEPVEAERLRTLVDSLRRDSCYDARRAGIADWNAGHRFVKRGIGLLPVKFGISFTASILNQAGALVLVYRDGSVQVNHGGIDMGQGLRAKVLGVAMRELGLPEASIRVLFPSTDKVPNTAPTAASTGADMNGMAVRDACATLRARIAEVVAEKLSATAGRAIAAKELRFEDGRVSVTGAPELAMTFAEAAEATFQARVPLEATGYYRTPGVYLDRARGKGRPFHYFALGCAVAEVEVDGSTGETRVVSVDILHDVGDSLNPAIDRGQIEGAFVQGIGWLTSEEVLWNPDGSLATKSASTYAIPTIRDAPARLHVRLFPRPAEVETIGRSKAVGEPPFLLALSVRSAIRDAVAAFGEGPTTRLDSPSTPEAVARAIDARTRV